MDATYEAILINDINVIRQLPKLYVVGSIPIARSNTSSEKII